MGLTREVYEARARAEQAELRDHFAIAALTGILADHTMSGDTGSCARFAYLFADAMLKERQK